MFCASTFLGRLAAGHSKRMRFYAEVIGAGPYRDLERKDFDDALEFVATGGYALQSENRYRRLRRTPDGSYVVALPIHARRYRMNVGTIVAEPTIKVKLGRRTLGEVEEYFIEGLVPGDTFMFAGQLLEFQRMHEMAAQCRRASGDDSESAGLYGRAVSDQHASRRARAGIVQRPRPVEQFSRTGAGMAGVAGQALAHPRARDTAG